MTIKEFIKELNPMVIYDKEQERHMMGSTILTNQELHHMLKVVVGEEYTKLSNTQQMKTRRIIFKEIM